MSGIDWTRVEAVAQQAIDPYDVATAVQRGLDSGDRVFRRRLALRWALAAVLVGAVTAASFVARAAVHDDQGPDGSVAPVVLTVVPASGPAAGGTVVTITGQGFGQVDSVAFGTVAATGFTVESDTRITATAPAGSGAVDVTVTSRDGTATTGGPAARYTYVSPPLPPVVQALRPNRGPKAGGTKVEIRGLGLTGATSVGFGTSDAAGFTVDSDTRITATSPAGSGTVSVVVTTPGGASATGTSAQRFTYTNPPALPVVQRVDPASGAPAGGATVTVVGQHLRGVSSVLFGGNQAPHFVIASDTRIIATTPAGTGTVDVSVRSSAGTSSAGQPGATYTYDEGSAPLVQASKPRSGCDTGGVLVVIGGMRLGGAVLVRFGTTAAAGFTQVSDAQVTATSPPGASGTTVDITVTTRFGTSSPEPKATFTFLRTSCPP